MIITDVVLTNRAVQYGGFTVTPIIGALISSYGRNHQNTSYSIIINQYSLPALFLASISICSIGLLMTFFTDVSREVITSDTSNDVEVITIIMHVLFLC